MTIVCVLKKGFERTPLTGAPAFFCALAAIAIPTILRCMIDSEITGIAFSPYIPFVLLAAVGLGARYAVFVTVISAAVADMLFIDPRFVPLAGPTDVAGIITFLVSAALIIKLVHAARTTINARVTPAPCGHGRTGVIFSLEKGQTLATWHGCDGPIRLGPEKEVAEMMRDFLAQLELGERLKNSGV